MRSQLYTLTWMVAVCTLVMTSCATVASPEPIYVGGQPTVGTCLEPGERYALVEQDDRSVVAYPDRSFRYDPVQFRVEGRCALLRLGQAVHFHLASDDNEEVACIPVGYEIDLPALHRRTASCRISSFGAAEPSRDDLADANTVPIPASITPPLPGSGLDTWQTYLLNRHLSAYSLAMTDTYQIERFQSIADRVMQFTRGSERSQIVIVDDRSHFMIDFGNGRALTTIQLLEHLEDSQIAFLLAKEVAHAQLQHAEQRRSGLSGPTAISAPIALGAAGRLESGLLPYSRRQIAEADQLAIDIVFHTGFDTLTAAQVLSMYSDPNWADYLDPYWAAIGPMSETRATKLHQYAQKRGYH